MNHTKKIIAFPFAGGNKYSFNPLFSSNTDVTVLEYPGRGSRVHEALIGEINALIDDAFLTVKKEITSGNDYIIYGHSMGALVGFLLCKKIEILGLKTPNKLVVSGRKSPVFLRGKILSNLPDEDFWNEVCKLGGMPEEIHKHPELVKYFVSILKSDFKCIENYQYKSQYKLATPIDVFYGEEENITHEEAKAWEKVTSKPVNVTELKGNHFFIFNNKKYFSEYFKNIQMHAII